MDLRITVDGRACTIIGLVLIFVVFWQGVVLLQAKRELPTHLQLRPAWKQAWPAINCLQGSQVPGHTGSMARSRSMLADPGIMHPTYLAQQRLMEPEGAAAGRDAAAVEATANVTAAALKSTEPPASTPAAPEEDLPTIFLSIAAYRDPECSATMHSVLGNAAHPERVHVAVCQQIKLPHEACLQKDTPHPEQVQTITIPYFQAKGPTVAREKVASLYKNEDIFMQIDSHSKLAQDWDNKAVAMLERCPAEKCVLSHYPPVMDSSGNEVPLICKSHWDEGSKLPSFAPFAFDVKIGQFMPTPFSGAGFILAPGDIVHEVPYDPNLGMMFVGEEILHSARVWTHGYDIFAPDENLVWHHYSRSENPNVYGDRPEEWWHEQQKSNARARYILGIDGEAKPADRDESDFSYSYYGMGEARTLQQYWEFAGIDVVSKNLTSEEKFCHGPSS